MHVHAFTLRALLKNFLSNFTLETSSLFVHFTSHSGFFLQHFSGQRSNFMYYKYCVITKVYLREGSSYIKPVMKLHKNSYF